MQENLEGPTGTITDEAISDFMDRGGEEPTFHPILKVWQAVLEPAREELGKKVSPQWAVRICSTYREVDFAHIPVFQKRYFELLLKLADVVDAEIETDDQCLTWTTPEEDVEHNSHHYRRVLTEWQKLILGRELEWEPTDKYAGVEIAVLSEVHKLFFANGTGITAYLDNIRFQFTEADQAALAAELDELRDEVLKEG